ncbi:hypothetical protein [Defluviimonas salinarum]|uniref:Uncharacterized protein n=1 Tax=Defluviimonas salinarum TaxID=2992147 RepID=A0ABT3J4B1_9RHOB|nr:hypothetical protein [Defluviimonas salinarum]MCW3782498.1 hypothetical protein [Defluviimonas salinarum]
MGKYQTDEAARALQAATDIGRSLFHLNMVILLAPFAFTARMCQPKRRFGLTRRP